MATAAVLLECTLVRIRVAGRARGKLNPGIPRLSVCTRRVALCAAHLQMCSRERKARLRMVESTLLYSRLIPVGGRMAPGAVRSEPALVLVLVAGRASRVQPHVGVAQVLRLQRSARTCAHLARVMAVAARHACMLSVEH